MLGTKHTGPAGTLITGTTANNPAGTLVVDTGALAAGDYEVIAGFSGQAAASDTGQGALERRDAANATSIWQVRATLTPNPVPSGWRWPRLTVAAGERIRIIVLGSVTNNTPVNGSIYYRRVG